MIYIYTQSLVIVLLLIYITVILGGTGFWYGETRPPNRRYDSLAYANMTVRIDKSFLDGPGNSLVNDPYDTSKLLHVGPTISRQTFDTQFVLDLNYAIGIEVERVYVTKVVQGDVHFSWESAFVIVQFIFLERNSTSQMTLLESISTLTQQIQDPKSKLYIGDTNITNVLDPNWGLYVEGWDISLRLLYAIEIIGKDAVKEDYFLNQGGLGVCDYIDSTNFSDYCEFERFFEDDVSESLNISSFRVQIMFIKKASLDSVLVHFRINPPERNVNEPNISTAIGNLMVQVMDYESALYAGNVTIRVDPLWGVSQTIPVRRDREALFTKKYYEYDNSRLLNPKRFKLITAYDRCKMNRRCNWGEVRMNQTTNDVLYYQRLYERGELHGINLFLEFEDWRLGSRGFSWKGSISPTAPGESSLYRARAAEGRIAGAHFSPFDQKSLGPDIPCYLSERNQGLVLDRSLQRTQIDMQDSLVDDLSGRIDWLYENIEWANMGPEHRARKDVRENLTWVRADFLHWWEKETIELQELSLSQCARENCTLLFNTSSLLLTGAINDVGELRLTEDGTEVAVYTFNSIYLGPEVHVTLVGQRAMALVSKTTSIINTTFHGIPGTLGGFPGGESVARFGTELYIDNPRQIYICELGDYCLQDSPGFNTTLSVADRDSITSNNVNGPGSGNLRVTPFVVLTSTEDIDEIQVITTEAKDGQTLAGGFTIRFKNFITPVIKHDATATDMKKIIEENLNIVSPNTATVRPLRGDVVPGVGQVDVSRSLQDSQEGYTWSVTFLSAIGNIKQLQVKSFLQGLNANISISTFQDGNELRGSFVLNFQGFKTKPIIAYATAAEVKERLLELPCISTVSVIRNDPTENCDDGLCPNGPYQGRGMVWTIYVTTDLTFDNISPTSPTSNVSKQEGFYYRVSADYEHLEGVNAAVSISWGTLTSPDDMASNLLLTSPFSLAFGGAGASYGGKGGDGYSENPTADTYNDEGISDLLGGSGGSMSIASIYAINSFKGVVPARGGNGGAAIEIIAANDIIIGSFGKISMRGEDAQQSSEGGAGGGSGGAILLTAGGTFLNEGLLDVSGGNGGFGGFGYEELSGGGGGGGRIAVFGESINNNGKVEAGGGDCGRYRIPVEKHIIILNMSIHMEMLTQSDTDTLFRLGAFFINNTIDTAYVTYDNYRTDTITNSENIEAIHALYFFTVTLDYSYNASHFDSTNIDEIQDIFDSQSGYNIADIFMLNTTIVDYKFDTINPVFSLATDCTNNGHEGRFYTKSSMTTNMYVRETNGGEGTKRALFLSNREESKSSSGSEREAPFSWNGPIIPFEASNPTRITYYTRLDAVEGESTKANFGVLFSLLSRGVAGLNVSSVIGVFTGDKITHGANFGSAVDEKTYLKRMVTIWNYPTFERWYKVDIFINWNNNTYSISLDDTVMSPNNPFSGDDIDGLRLSVTRSVDVWFDEIYVGFDNTMSFVCPITTRKGTETVSPPQKHWSLEELSGGGDGFTEYHDMIRHYSHLDVQGQIAFDGRGAVKTNQDLKFKYPSGDYPITQGKLHAGALMFIQNSLRSAKTPSGRTNTLVSKDGLWYAAKDGIGGAGDGRQYWYTEHNFISPLSESMNGGVAACSSQDLLTWRFEGFIFQYSNLSDMVFGSEGPFYVERPKVKFCELTQMYVMWAVMDNNDRSLAMNAVANSPYEDGPFLFRRSFYPDGNGTRDQVIFVNDELKAVLGRTYYQTVEYLLPEAIMQPVWESVKDRSGIINFRINYLRAFYDKSYDSYHDIFDQRWRNEDIPWKVKCVNKLTLEEREVPAGEYNEFGAVCNDPEEYKVVIGQGDPVVKSLFVSPGSANNSWWMQTSVPSVKAQPWASNYRDGYCGIRQLDDNHDVLDPSLYDPTTGIAFDSGDRSDCSNIADNPVHVSDQDKLIGVQKVITSRRAKYMAISELTPDFMDTTGNLFSFEGELDSGDLISMIIEMGQFGFGAGDEVKSTFAKPVRSDFETAIDYQYRFRQYIRNFNDRALYSLGCVLDGMCKVDYKSQLTANQ
jgi:hypothetical protein